MERTALAALAAPSWSARHGRAGAAGESATNGGREIVILAPGSDVGAARRIAAAVHREMETGLPGHTLTVAVSRHAEDPSDLHRAGTEALLAANVAEARGLEELSFEETGAYRLLLPAMSEDPRELQGFFEETVAPLVDYDEQYETDLVRTLEKLSGRGRQRGPHGRAPVHPPAHDPLPPGAGARPVGPRRVVHGRPRAAVARPQGHEGAGHPTRPAVPRTRRARRPVACRWSRRTAEGYFRHAFGGESSNGKTSGFGPENGGFDSSLPSSAGLQGVQIAAFAGTLKNSCRSPSPSS